MNKPNAPTIESRPFIHTGECLAVTHYNGIQYIVGYDLLEALDNQTVDLLAHQTNCKGVMGSGIALNIANRWPIVEQEDRRICNSDLNPAGQTHVVIVPDVGLVANVYGQEFPGANTDYELMRSGLKGLREYIRLIGDETIVGLPLMGCGVGGGDWSIVSEIIKDELDGLEFYVFVLNDTVFNEVVVV